MNTEELINVILDNRNEADEVLVKAVENYISERRPFYHDEEKTTDACQVVVMEGIRPLLENPIENIGTNNSKIVEAYENTFSKREACFYLGQARVENLFLRIKLGSLLGNGFQTNDEEEG